MVYQKTLIILLIGAFFLRLPSLFEPFTYADEGIYLTLGQAMRQGKILYREIHDNKPPLLYLLAALAGNFTYFRLLLMIWSLLTIYFFSVLARSLFPQKQLAWVLATGLFAILTSIHTFEGNIANAENFMLLPTIAGFWLILKNLKNKSMFPFFLAGSFFALAALFKIPAAFDFLAALILLCFISIKRKKKLAAILGFALPFLMTFIYFYCQKALFQYLTAVFNQNIAYLSSWGGQSQAFSLPISLLVRSLIVVEIVIIAFLFRKKLSLASQLILIWFSFSLFAALLSSRPYPHYLLQVMPSLSLAFGLILTHSGEKFLPFFLMAVFVAAFWAFHFWHYPNLSYYLNFYQFALGRKTKDKYFTTFDSRAEMTYQLVHYIRSHTQVEEPIFIWGTEPSVYALSRRQPVGRYTTSYHIIDFNAYQETMLALRKAKPNLIIVSREEARRFSELEDFLDNYYFKNYAIGGNEIYRLRESEDS